MSADIAYMRGLDNKRRPPIVRYRQRARFDQALTDRNGRSTYVDEDVAEITSPDQGVTSVKTVEEWFKQIESNPGYAPWAQAYKQMYRDWKEANDTAAVQGTHLKNWPLLSPAQCESLLQAGFRTIEDVSKMSDEAAATIDGGAYIRSKARYWINAAEDMGEITTRIASLEAENATLRAQVDELGSKLAEVKGENERLTQHFTGKEGYDIIAGRVQAAGLNVVQAGQAQQTPAAAPPAFEPPPAPEGPKNLTLAEVQALSMQGLRDYCYERDVKPHPSKDTTYERLVEAGALAE